MNRAPAKITTQTNTDRNTLSLADSVVVTLSLEGPAPLRVEPPASFLSDDSAAVWKVAKQEIAKREMLPDGRERWSATLQIEPFVPGPSVPLQFASANVTAGADVAPVSVSWDGLELRVVSSLDAKTAVPRPITGVETPPMAPIVVETSVHPDRLAVAFGLLLLAAGMLVLARRRRRRGPENPATTALRELDRLRSVPESAKVLDRVVLASRRFLESRAGIPATRLTTGEFSIAAEALDVPGAAEWRQLFETCEASRFTSTPPTPDACRSAIDTATRLIRLAEESPR